MVEDMIGSVDNLALGPGDAAIEHLEEENDVQTPPQPSRKRVASESPQNQRPKQRKERIAPAQLEDPFVTHSDALPSSQPMTSTTGAFIGGLFAAFTDTTHLNQVQPRILQVQHSLLLQIVR